MEQRLEAAHFAGFSLGSARQDARAVRFAVLLQETHSSFCQLNDTLTLVDPHLCSLGAGILPGTTIKAGLIRKLFLYDVFHNM
jgi:hypothetical protein